MPTITPEILLGAYAAGLFPMAETAEDRRLFWVDPERRGILPLDGFHLPRSLRRTIRRNPFTVTSDQAFAEVVEACAEARPERPQTWINREIRRLYVELAALGFAHSVECWRNGRLAGGLYGVSLGAAFFGESMVSRETDASKVALVHLVARLRVGGYRLLDTQFRTDHLDRFGAIEIPRAEYRRRLEAALAARARFPPALDDAAVLAEFAALPAA